MTRIYQYSTKRPNNIKFAMVLHQRAYCIGKLWLFQQFWECNQKIVTFGAIHKLRKQDFANF